MPEDESPGVAGQAEDTAAPETTGQAADTAPQTDGTGAADGAPTEDPVAKQYEELREAYGKQSNELGELRQIREFVLSDPVVSQALRQRVEAMASGAGDLDIEPPPATPTDEKAKDPLSSQLAEALSEAVYDPDAAAEKMADVLRSVREEARLAGRTEAAQELQPLRLERLREEYEGEVSRLKEQGVDITTPEMQETLRRTEDEFRREFNIPPTQAISPKKLINLALADKFLELGKSAAHQEERRREEALRNGAGTVGQVPGQSSSAPSAGSPRGLSAIFAAEKAEHGL